MFEDIPVWLQGAHCLTMYRFQGLAAFGKSLMTSSHRNGERDSESVWKRLLVFCFVCLKNKLFGKCDLWLSVRAHFQLLFVGCMKQHFTEAIEYKGLLRQCKKSEQANNVSHIIFFKGISTCVCVCCLEVSASALVCGSQTILHLYWNFQVLSVLLLASAQHWPPRALIL